MHKHLVQRCVVLNFLVVHSLLLIIAARGVLFRKYRNKIANEKPFLEHFIEEFLFSGTEYVFFLDKSMLNFDYQRSS